MTVEQILREHDDLMACQTAGCPGTLRTTKQHPSDPKHDVLTCGECGMSRYRYEGTVQERTGDPTTKTERNT